MMLLFSTLLYAQHLNKIRILDSEEGNPIANARVLFHGEIAYSNDDGFIMIPQNTNEVEVSKSGYNTIKINKMPSVIRLSPAYKEIEEIKIVNVDIRKIFIDVHKNYKKVYNTDPSIYEIVYKQKDYFNDSLSFLLIADAQVWTADNSYNFKAAQEKEYDGFVQLELNSLKHLNSSILGNNICEGYSINQSRDFVGNLFFNYELRRTLNYFRIEGAKYSGRLIRENGNEQIINFKISTSIIDVYGLITYNKIDKAITNYEINYDQSKFPAEKRITSTNESFEYKVGNGVIIYEFYKTSKKYLPSFMKTRGYSYCIYGGVQNKNAFDREIIFRRHQKAKTSGLVDRIDLNKKIWENIPTRQTNQNNIILSREEERFLNETAYEN